MSDSRRSRSKRLTKLGVLLLAVVSLALFMIRDDAGLFTSLVVDRAATEATACDDSIQPSEGRSGAEGLPGQGKAETKVAKEGDTGSTSTFTGQGTAESAGPGPGRKRAPAHNVEARVESLRHAYAEAGLTFGTRGVTWLLERHGLFVTGYFDVALRSVVFEEAYGRDCDASMLSIWVRMTGDELLAGVAVPAPTKEASCRWTFTPSAAAAGEFVLEAKLVDWNGANDWFLRECNIEKNQSPAPDAQPGIDIQGFKFYSPASSCCQVCTRVSPGECTHWETPGRGGSACTLYAKDAKDPKDAKDASGRRPGDADRRRRLGDKRDKVAHGTRRKSGTYAYYLGCGWSFGLSATSPCLDSATDDDVLLESRTVTLAPATATPTATANRSKLPLCRPGRLPGRWAPLDAKTRAGCAYDPMKQKKQFSGKFPLLAPVATDDGKCWMQENIQFIAERCLEANCKDLKKHTQWQSSGLRAKNEREGAIRTYWAPDGCRLDYLNPAQVQQCITDQKISDVQLRGASISEFLHQYFVANKIKEGVRNGKNKDGKPWAEGEDWMVFHPERKDGKENAKGEGRKVLISTLKSPHLLWHMSEKEMRESFEREPKLDPAKEIRFFVTTMLISSEREHNVMLGRAELFNRLARKILGKKGWLELDFFHPSAAFTYDSATQGDGLHVVGPPMKAVFAQVWSHVCNQ